MYILLEGCKEIIAAATMNNHWGYCNFDHQYKTPQMLVRKLVECVSKGGAI